MPILYGKISPLTNCHATPYAVFERQLLEEGRPSKAAIITTNGVVTFRDLNKMVTSISLWLQRKLKILNGNAGQTAEGDPSNDEDPRNRWCFYEEQIKPPPKTDYKNYKGPKDRKDIIIGICMNRSPELIALVLAIWKLHLSYVPLDPSVPVKRTISSIEQTEPQLIVCNGTTLKEMNDLVQMKAEHPNSLENLHSLSMSDERKRTPDQKISDYSIINLEDCLSEYNQSYVETSEIQHEGAKDKCVKDKLIKKPECSCVNNLACIVFTSGSSGRPKGVRLNTNNLMNRITWQWNEYPYDSQDICLWSKPLIYVDAITELFSPLLKGTPIVIPGEHALSPEIIMRYVTLYEVTRLSIVPSFMKLLLDYLITSKESVSILKSIKLWITGGEALPKWLLAKFYEFFPVGKIANFYGCTEVTGAVSGCVLSPALSKDSNQIPLGTPIQNTAIVIFKEEGNAKVVLEEGTVGEIGIAGLNVSDGYCEQTACSTVDSDHKFLPLSSFYFKEREDVRKFHKYLSDVRYFTGERYGIMEQTISESTKTTHQTFIRCSRNESPDKYRKFSLVGGNASEMAALTSLDIKDHRKKTRALSICAPSTMSSGSYIVADEIELLNKFKGVKSFSDVGNLPIDPSYRRGSMPFAISPSVVEACDTSRNTPIKSKFKPNIKTTAELVTAEVSKHEISSSDSHQSQIESFLQMTQSSIPQQSEASVSSSPHKTASNPASESKVGTSATSHSFETSHPISTSSSTRTFYILKQISSLHKEKLAVHTTGDLGSIENGTLYYHGRKDLPKKTQASRTDSAESEAKVIMG